MRERYDRRRAEVVLGAARVFAERGYDQTSVPELAEALGLAAGSLYHYFPSKEHLLVSALGRWLEDFEQNIGPQLYPTDDPYASLWHVVEALHRAFGRRPLLGEAMARAYVVADASVAVEVEMVRSQLIDLFADAVSRGTPTESHVDVGGLLTDVLASNLLAVAHDRAQMGDVRRRFQLVVELLASRHGTAIGSPDWHGTRSVTEQSVHWFYDWAPRTAGSARSAR